MNIPMPTPQEKARSIEYIKKICLPEKTNIFSVVKYVFSNFGVRNMFFGFSDGLYIALMCFGCVCVAWFITSPRYAYTVAFAVSPLFYVIAYLISMWKESLLGTLTVQKSCKFTPVYLMAFRMMLLSSISIAIDVPAMFAASFVMNTDFFKLLLTTFCSLFAYGAISVGLLILLSRRWVQSVLPLVWAGATLFSLLLYSERCEKFLSSLPVTVLIMLCVILAVLYLLQLNVFVKRGEKEYAYR